MTRLANPAACPEELGAHEFRFTERDFQIIAGMLKKDIGIVLEQGKMPLVYARLARRVRALGLKGFAAYCAFLASEKGSAERIRMCEALTTNVTCFFREAHHFDLLKRVVLPPLLETARRGARVRLWSAGCSTGEEAYSIALSILSIMDDAPRFDIRILASDIDAGVLESGRRGLYSRNALALVDAGTRAARFDVVDVNGEERWSIRQEARALVSFRRHNLIGHWPMRGPFQAIFCRNTVIYFDDTARNAVWGQLTDLLAPGGYFFVGHSERLPAALRHMHPAGLTAYRKSRAGDIVEQDGDSDG